MNVETVLARSQPRDLSLHTCVTCKHTDRLKFKPRLDSTLSFLVTHKKKGGATGGFFDEGDDALDAVGGAGEHAHGFQRSHIFRVVLSDSRSS